MTFFGEYYFTNFGEYIFENLNKSLKLSQILVTKFLKISLIQQNFHQFWWKKMCKIINKYCHQFRWNFHHLITHYFLWFNKKKSPELVKIQPKIRQKIKMGSYLSLKVLKFSSIWCLGRFAMNWSDVLLSSDHLCQMLIFIASQKHLVLRWYAIR